MQGKQSGRRDGDTSDAGQENQKQRERLLPVQSAMLRRSRFASTLVQRIGRDGPAVGRRKLAATGLTAQAPTVVPQRNPRTAKLAAKPHVRAVGLLFGHNIMSLVSSMPCLWALAQPKAAPVRGPFNAVKMSANNVCLLWFLVITCTLPTHVSELYLMLRSPKIRQAQRDGQWVALGCKRCERTRSSSLRQHTRCAWCCAGLLLPHSPTSRRVASCEERQ